MITTARTLTITWITLMVATIAAFVLCEMGSDVGRWAIWVAMLIAAVKAGAVLHFFMELHEGTAAWKAAFGVWLSYCTALIAGLYYFTV